MTANDNIKNSTIRHAVYMERLKTREVGKAVKMLNDTVLPDLMASISRIEGMGLDPRKRKEQMRIIRTIMDNGVGSMSVEMTERLQKIGVAEAGFTAKTMEKSVPIEISFSTPNLRTLRTLINTNPFQGHILSEWYDDLSRSAADAVFRELQIGMTLGESVPELTSRIRGTKGAGFGDGTFKQIVTRAEAVTRTAINHVSTTAREATYSDNDDIVKEVQFVATLDGRTTDICMGLDGKVFPINEGPRPPMHYGCRSTTVPVLKSWKELGIDLKEAPEGTRASMNGQVSEKETYGTWLKKQPLSFQRDVLGKTKAELFNRGLVPIEKFTDYRHEPMTIKQILKKEGISQDEIYSLRKQDVA